MIICHVSDTHKLHENLILPECDLLIHSGDIGGRTNLEELTLFLSWFEKQPADKKILVPGNHDIVLDKKWPHQLKSQGSDYGSMIAHQQHSDAMTLLKNYDVIYLCDSSYDYKGVKIWGSAYSPSFHRTHWAFNADRGQEIQKVWGKIPSDVEVLITHTPVRDILDRVEERYRQHTGENLNVGCDDLFAVMQKRLMKLKLHCFGHIHDNYGVVYKNITTNRRALFSNGAVLTNEYTQLITRPLTINL